MNLFIISFLALMKFFQPEEAQNYVYVALGDSYTICEGVDSEKCWTKLLTDSLAKSNIKVALKANPSRSGFSSQDLIDYELPVLNKYKPNFVTLLIGVNDVVRGIDTNKFTKNFNYIIDEIVKITGSKDQVLLFTIPDFALTPGGKRLGNSAEFEKSLIIFNSIIIKIAKERGMHVVDLFQLTVNLPPDPDLLIKDHLHPSAKQYKLWNELIYKEVLTMLKPNKE